MKQRIIDPVDEKTEKEKETQDNEMAKAFDISNLKISDFKAVTIKDAKSVHPFDGYPEKKVQVGVYVEKGKEKPLMIPVTWIMAYRGQPPNDPSGKGVTLGYPELRNAEGRVIRPSTERKGDIEGSYSIRAKDYESRGVDIDCVFDRTVTLEDGELKNVAFVPSPSCRAQIIFEYDSKTQKVQPRGGKNPLFLLADSGQFSRLRRLYEMIINPRIRLEQSIAAHFDDSVDTTQAKDLPGIPTGD